jgi:hypothetical protein
MNLAERDGQACQQPGRNGQASRTATRAILARLEGAGETDDHFIRCRLGRSPGWVRPSVPECLNLHRHVQATMPSRHGVGVQQGCHPLQEDKEGDE